MTHATRNGDPTLRISAFIAVVVLVSTLNGCGNRPEGASEGRDHKSAPNFALEDVSGKTVRLSDSQGRVRLVDFWATWCAPCREAIPDFKDLHAKYAEKGLTILAISMDDEPRKILPPFVEQWKIPYTNLIGSDEVAESFGGVFGLPTTFLVDRDGSIVDRWVGGVPKEVFEKEIRKALGLDAAAGV